MKWCPVPETISTQTFFDLFDNKIPYLLVDDFLSPLACRKLSLAIQQAGLNQYDYNFDVESAPAAEHLFETHYLYENKTPEDYFPKAQASLDAYDILCRNAGLYPDKKVMEFLEKNLQKPVSIATQAGQRYSHIIIRELKNSALLHADFAHFIPSYWSISNVIAQYAWNIYLTDPLEGGECVVYNKPWEKEDDIYILNHTYGYSHDVVKGKERVEIPVKTGRLVFFNSRNFHEVKASKNSRLSLGGHIGLTKHKEIIMWV